jgi:hypothetical protein
MTFVSSALFLFPLSISISFGCQQKVRSRRTHTGGGHGLARGSDGDSTRTWMGARLQAKKLASKHAKVAMLDVSFVFLVLFLLLFFFPSMH